jgi:hypothetical protein
MEKGVLAAVVAGRLLQVLRTSRFEPGSPPARKANAPVEENVIEVAGAVRG